MRLSVLPTLNPLLYLAENFIQSFFLQMLYSPLTEELIIHKIYVYSYLYGNMYFFILRCGDSVELLLYKDNTILIMEYA